MKQNKLKWTLLTFSIVLISASLIFLCLNREGNPPMDWTDSNFESAFANYIEKPTYELNEKDILDITELALYCYEDLFIIADAYGYSPSNGTVAVPSSLIDLEKFTNLRRLYIEGNIDLSGVKLPKSITWLYVKNNPIPGHVEYIGKLQQLMELNYYSDYKGVTDLTSFAGLTKLEVLCVNAPCVPNLRGVEKMTSLRLISVSNLTEDISQIRYLWKLESVNFHNSLISDINVLGNLNQLKSISIGSADLTDITPLSNCKQLTELSMSPCLVNDFSPLKNLSLNKLSLNTLNSENPADFRLLTKEQITFLETLQLTHLIINVDDKAKNWIYETFPNVKKGAAEWDD